MVRVALLLAGLLLVAIPARGEQPQMLAPGSTSLTSQPSFSFAQPGTTAAVTLDPTALTTQQVLREISTLKELIYARLDGMDKAIALTQQYPTLLDKAVADLKSIVDQAGQSQSLLFNERLRRIDTQISERDSRTEQVQRDSKVAVDAAFAAAKEAVGEQNNSNALAIAKSEAAFTKQIDQIGTLIATAAKANDDKIGDIKDRITAIESHSQGAGDLWVVIVGAIGAVGSLLAIFLILSRRDAPLTKRTS